MNCFKESKSKMMWITQPNNKNEHVNFMLIFPEQLQNDKHTICIKVKPDAFKSTYKAPFVITAAFIVAVFVIIVLVHNF